METSELSRINSVGKEIRQPILDKIKPLATFETFNNDYFSHSTYFLCIIFDHVIQKSLYHSYFFFFFYNDVYGLSFSTSDFNLPCFDIWFSIKSSQSEATCSILRKDSSIRCIFSCFHPGLVLHRFHPLTASPPALPHILGCSLSDQLSRMLHGDIINRV